MHWCGTYYSLVSLCIDGNVFVVTRKEPVGVAGQIIPWVLFYFILLRFYLEFELICGNLTV
jgi:acyl-CoA reductase-like NAD-dependent aldehyde dehydrogenase